ncbi:MAG: YegS/Rv2252/BmrU family lipid kinase [Clostridiales bacterium]|nr:YegS/Rv2252/BmrU family lipid kinase [Clostridiales bacterium]
MERVKLIVNPSSGRQILEPKVDHLCKLLLDNGYIVGKYFTESDGGTSDRVRQVCNSGDWDMIIACGGDGTVNEVVTGIVGSQTKLPVAIYAGGTVNDFANYINMPTKITDFFNVIKEGLTIDIDLGKVNDRYFINVAAGGLLTDVGFQAPVEAKAILGRMAYYFEGLRGLLLQGIEPIHIEFESDEYTKKEDVLLFLVSNSSSIGGFKKLAPNADILDGLLDVLIIKDSDIVELANIFFNVLKGEHIKHPNVVYFKTKEIYIRSDPDKRILIDTDGEMGEKLPANFKVVPRGVKIIVSKESYNYIKDISGKATS